VFVRLNQLARFIVNANHGVPIRLAKVARFFQNSAHMKTTALPLGNSTNRSPVQIAFLGIPLAVAFAWFALAPAARAACLEGCLTNANTVLGEDALISNTGGFDNTATGAFALQNNTTGSNNTANGVGALENNATGNANTGIGVNALANNTTDGANTAIGYTALFSNTTGYQNTANGANALFSNTIGIQNTATGYQALNGNTTGNYNTASGQGSLYSNTTGRNNTAEGQNALRSNTTGSYNIALGSNAGTNLTTGSNNIDIFDRGVAGEANTIRIGRQGIQTTTFIAGISGATVPTGVAVIVDASGHLGTTTSSARFKEAIEPMDKASEAILGVKPVTFRYKHELDPEGIPQFGLVAEDVEKVNPDLVARDADGKAYTVRYEAVNAMLLNEFLKEHRKGQEQDATISQLKAELAQQQTEITALSAQIQKVSAQVELSKPALRTVLNNQ
jgi:hypothetical protein